MADRKRTGLNNQKRGVSVMVAPFVEADVLTTGSLYATLPPRSLIIYGFVNVLTASGTATATLDITANGTVVFNEVDVDDTGAKLLTGAEDAMYLATGGDVVVKAGAVTPADGALVGELVLFYVELDKTTGEYTN